VVLEARVDLMSFNSRQLYSMYLPLMLMIRNPTLFAHILKLLNISADTKRPYTLM
jgi:hypothetical protein